MAALELARVVVSPAPEWTHLPDAELVAHLVDPARAAEGRSLPYVVSLLARVAGWHRHRNAKLGVLCEAGEELAEALEAHRAEEEHRLCTALLDGGPGRGATQRDLERLRRRHGALALLLSRIRWLADDYAVPPWADHAYQALMEELAELEEDVLEHVHLEAHLLLPRLAARCAPRG